VSARHHLLAALMLAGLFLSVAGALKYAVTIDLIAPDVAVRATQAIIGLSLAIYANFMPKNLGPWRSSAQATARAQSALRVGGWSFMLAGIAYAAIWTVAPLSLADSLSIPVMASAIVVTLGYGAWALGACVMRGREAT
jgi:hypothetical protein